MIKAIEKEIAIRPLITDATGSPLITSLYFGGGTPSMLRIDELKCLLDTIHQRFQLIPDLEITLEANPDDMKADSLKAWREMGINRLSIGIQSFNDADLQWMNRSHDAAAALHCMQAARDAGFDNFSIDLIYGMPGLSDEQWAKNLQIATDANVPHLSCYALTVESQTPLEKKIRLHQKAPADPEQQVRHFNWLMQHAENKGYLHYEISNFALPGKESRHNSSYWSGVPYYGFGPSAHSFDGKKRQWNIANNALYIRAIECGQIPLEEEVLTPQQQLNEYIMTSLRTSKGVAIEQIRRLGGGEVVDGLLLKAAKHLSIGNLSETNDHYVLTPQGKHFADGIAADLFV